MKYLMNGESSEVSKVTEYFENTNRLIRLKEVLHLVGCARSTLYKWISEGKFPKPIKLGKRMSAWRLSQVEEFIQKLMCSNREDSVYALVK